MKEFIVQDVHFFDNSESEFDFFPTQERQWLVLRILESIRAKRTDLINIKCGDGDLMGNLLDGQPIIPKCLSSGIITRIFPIHEATQLERLQNIWVRDLFAKQPLGN